MHISGSENMNQQTDKRNKTNVYARKPVHSESEIRTETAHLNPSPDMIENRFLGKKRAGFSRSDAERDHKCHDTRHADRRTRDNRADRFIPLFQPTAVNPVDNRTDQRRENY